MRRDTEEALRFIGWALLILLLLAVLGIISLPFLKIG